MITGTKLQKIQAASKEIRLAEGVHPHVALSWAWQAYREWEAQTGIAGTISDDELSALFFTLDDPIDSPPASAAVEDRRRLSREWWQFQRDIGAHEPIPSESDAKWRALRARAAHLEKNPAAKKPARVVHAPVGAPKNASQRALRRRQKAEALLPPLLSAEESWKAYGAKPRAPEYVWKDSPGCAAVSAGPQLVKIS